ncbi:hypothetical protein Mx9_p38 [Myxococcus phage Mx9]|nr:hypothetical protein Mx9_p38 [Myxococcus phage Mx9]
MTTDNGRGQYLYGKRLRSLDASLGRVYESHGAEGQPALLQVPTGEAEGLRLEPVSVLVTTFGGEGGVAVEVQGEPPPQGVSTGAVLEALEAGADLVEALEHRPDVAGHLSRVRPRARPEQVHPQPVHLRWLPELVAAAACGLLLWPQATVDVRVPPQVVERVSHVALPEGTPQTVWMTDVMRFSSTKSESWSVGRVRVPDRPLPGQDTPPCPKGYQVINGGCWAELKQKAPNCPRGSAEWNGGCYLPIRGSEPVPMSIGRERGR